MEVDSGSARILPKEDINVLILQVKAIGIYFLMFTCLSAWTMWGQYGAMTTCSAKICLEFLKHFVYSANPNLRPKPVAKIDF